MTYFLADSIFYGLIVAFAFLIYQAAILPGIRQTLRFEIFKLRDELRSLVVQGVIAEQDKGFVLLHGHLNFMVSSLPRFDVYGAFRALESLDAEKREEIGRRLQLLQETPAQIRGIYEQSLKVFVKALILNSLLFFILLSIIIMTRTLFEVGIGHLATALRKKAEQDAALAFFNASQAVV